MNKLEISKEQKEKLEEILKYVYPDIDYKLGISNWDEVREDMIYIRTFHPNNDPEDNAEGDFGFYSYNFGIHWLEFLLNREFLEKLKEIGYYDFGQIQEDILFDLNNSMNPINRLHHNFKYYISENKL